MNPYIINEINRHIRLFLHHINVVDEALSDIGAKPLLHTSYSYLSLPGLIQVIEEYGSVRNVWEGSIEGEGILADIKPLIKDLRKNWNINAGLKHHRMKSMKKVMEPYMDESKRNDMYTSMKHCSYQSKDHLINLFNENKKPVSILILKDGSHVVELSGDKYVTVEQEDYSLFHFGLHYWNWHINDEEVTMDVNIFDVEHYCILLPLLIEAISIVGHNVRPYSLITSKAMEMDGKGNIVYSKFTNATDCTRESNDDHYTSDLI